jgi:hypothetical protein
MRRLHWTDAVAALWLIVGGLGGLWLVLHRASMLWTAGDCISQTGLCYTDGHPFIWPGSLVLVAAVVGAVILWMIRRNLKSGRTAGGIAKAARRPARPRGRPI